MILNSSQFIWAWVCVHSLSPYMCLYVYMYIHIHKLSHSILHLPFLFYHSNCPILYYTSHSFSIIISAGFSSHHCTVIYLAEVIIGILLLNIINPVRPYSLYISDASDRNIKLLSWTHRPTEISFPSSVNKFSISPY